MSKLERTRIDYMPGAAALDALALASDRFPNMNRQALIDRLVIVAMSALNHEPWRPPHLSGHDRDRWALPQELVPDED